MAAALSAGGASAVGLFPETIRHRGPFRGGFDAFIREFPGCFQILIIRTLRMALLHNLRQPSRIVQYQAGTQQILIPWLVK